MTQAVFLSDLSGALNALDLGASSKVFAIASPVTVRTIAMMHSAGLMFPNMGILGGSIAGIEIVASDSDAVSNSIVVVDASGIVVDDSNKVVLHTSSQADVQLDTTPTDGAAQRISLWQHDLFAVKAERFFAVQPLRASAIAVITGVTETTA